MATKQRLPASNGSLGYSLHRRLPPFELREDPPDTPSLEHSETRLQKHSHPLPIDYEATRECCTCFRHSGWTQTRWAIYHSLRRCGIAPKVLFRFAECGTFATVWADPERPERLQVRGNFCRHRYCLPCAKNRSRIIASNLHAAIAGRVTRFLTLTLRHTDAPLADQIDRLQHAFTRLRRRAFWIKRVDAGAWFIELTYNSQNDRWHPHLHIVTTGRYMDHESLRATWHRITGDSYIVDIRLIRDPDRAAGYVSKYASKPMATAYVHAPHRLDEAIEALHGRRLCGTFGDWRHIKLTELPDDPTDWRYVGNLGCMILAANRGDHVAKHVIYHLTNQPPNPVDHPPPILGPPADVPTTNRWDD